MIHTANRTFHQLYREWIRERREHMHNVLTGSVIVTVLASSVCFIVTAGGQPLSPLHSEYSDQLPRPCGESARLASPQPGAE